MRKLSRTTKMRRLLQALEAHSGSVSLRYAAKLLYGSEKPESQQKVLRLLAAYRSKTQGCVDLRVCHGLIVGSVQPLNQGSIRPIVGFTGVPAKAE